MSDTIINKVADSGLITIDLFDYIKDELFIELDIRPFLFMDAILKEAHFREELKKHDWELYRHKIVCIICSQEAIIPTWAYMLLTCYLETVCKKIIFGDLEKAKEQILLQNIQSINPTIYQNAKIVIKGCGTTKISDAAFIALTFILKPVCKSIFYGEPCSTVPIYKSKNNVLP